MISVIIPTLNSQATLAATLESLIPAAVEGLVREVIVADGGSKDATVRIADGFGARVLVADPARSDRLISGAQHAKFSWLLFLEPDCTLQLGWEREVEKLAAQIETGARAPTAATFRYTREDRTWCARTAEFAARVSSAMMGIAHSEQGLLIPRSLYAEAGGFLHLEPVEFADLARRVGRQRITKLRSVALSQGNTLRLQGTFKTLLHYYGCVTLLAVTRPKKRRVSPQGQLASQTPPT